MNGETKISFIIPVTQSTDPADITKLIESILSQNYQNNEILMVPDNENTARFFRDLVHVLPPPNDQVASSARNYAANMASGDILAFIDDDIILDKNWCRMIVEAFGDPTVGAVTGKACVDRKGLDWIPVELRWVIGASYWNYESITDVYGAAGMNFCVLRDIFFSVNGYDRKLGPRGDRPENSSWRRLGAEESDLALRIIIIAKRRVVYNPNAIVVHKLRDSSISITGLLKRSLHVGHNRAYINCKFSDELRNNSDVMVIRNISKQIPTYINSFFVDPINTWKRLSFSVIVTAAVVIGFFIGEAEFRNLNTPDTR